MRVPIILLSGTAGSGKDTVAQFLGKNHGAVVIAQADPMKRLVAKLFGFTEAQLWGPSELRNLPAPIPEWAYIVDDLRKTLLSRFDCHAGAWLDEVLPCLSSIQRDRAYGELLTWVGTWGPRVEKRVETPRRILQTLGTEWGRNFSKNMWVDLALKTAQELLEGGWFYSRTQGLYSSAPADRPDLISGATPNLVVITDGRFRNEVLAVRTAGGATVKIVTPSAGLQGDAAKHVSETEQNGIPRSWFDVEIHNDKAHGLNQLENTVGFMATTVLRCNPEELKTWEATKGRIPSWQGAP